MLSYDAVAVPVWYHVCVSVDCCLPIMCATMETTTVLCLQGERLCPCSCLIPPVPVPVTLSLSLSQSPCPYHFPCPSCHTLLLSIAFIHISLSSLPSPFLLPSLPPPSLPLPSLPSIHLRKAPTSSRSSHSTVRASRTTRMIMKMWK